MDGKFPSCTVNGHEVADNSPWGYQQLCNTNDISSESGKVLTEGNYADRYAGDPTTTTAWPPSLHDKVFMKDYYFNFMNTEYDKLFIIQVLRTNAVLGASCKDARNPT